MENKLKTLVFISVLFLTNNLGAQEGLVGQWTFDDPNNLCTAMIGSDLLLVGSQTTVAGPEASNGAICIGIGSYYIMHHNIAANGNGSRVNEFTLVMDIKISQLGRWYTLYQTDPFNADDGEWFIDTFGKVGVKATGYTEPLIDANRWYRLAIAVKNGSRYDYYINGRLVLTGQANGVDGRFSLGPSFLLFADDNKEDNPIDVAEIKLFSRALADQEIATLGGFGLSDNSTPFLSMAYGADRELVVSIDPAAHNDYGFAYPVTYKMGIPAGCTSLTALKRFSSTGEWTTISEKSANDFFNGIETVRFNYATATAFVSAAFGNETDSLMVKIVNKENLGVPISFQEICRYYDDRDAAVTGSADDWADNGDQTSYHSDEAFQITCRQFRKYHLWLSCGVITSYCNPATWQHIQTQLDSGYVEACSHSRTHPSGPYADPASQIAGSKQDLLINLNMPDLFSRGDKEYVYTWIAPANYYDEIVNTLVGEEQYVINRRYNESFDRFAEWNDGANYYHTCGISREASPIWKGKTDLDTLNSYFDLVVAKQGIYHLMTHPYFLLEQGFAAAHYAWEHLAYISNKKNLWYTSLGHLYLYHYLQENAPLTVPVAKKENKTATDFMLCQNYPNPFNSTTSLVFSLTQPSFVTLKIYSLLGEEIATLVDERLAAGTHKTVWHGSDCASGIYYFVLETGEKREIRKAILIK